MPDELRLIFNKDNPKPDRYTGNPISDLRPTTPEAAKERLVQGNKVFSDFMKSCADPKAEKTFHLHCNTQEIQAVDGQDPFAVILGCSDARVPTEVALSQGFNDLFTVRTAGNTLAHKGEGKGSVRYALRVYTPKVRKDVSQDPSSGAAHHESLRSILVLGHAECGAVKAAITYYIQYGGKLPGESVEHPELITIVGEIYDAIREVLDSEKIQPEDTRAVHDHLKQEKTGYTVAHINAKRSAERVKSMLDQMIKDGEPPGNANGSRIDGSLIKVYYSVFDVKEFTIDAPTVVGNKDPFDPSFMMMANRFAEEQVELKREWKVELDREGLPQM